jgi:hypothetical protein
VWPSLFVASISSTLTLLSAGGSPNWPPPSLPLSLLPPSLSLLSWHQSKNKRGETPENVDDEASWEGRGSKKCRRCSDAIVVYDDDDGSSACGGGGYDGWSYEYVQLLPSGHNSGGRDPLRRRGKREKLNSTTASPEPTPRSIVPAATAVDVRHRRRR